jgi:hypothetical protein
MNTGRLFLLYDYLAWLAKQWSPLERPPTPLFDQFGWLVFQDQPAAPRARRVSRNPVRNLLPADCR